MKKGFTIENFDLTAPDQIGLVSADARETAAGLVRTFGLPDFDFFTPEYRGRMYQGRPAAFSLLIGVSRLSGMQVEIIQPVSGQSIHADFLANTDGGLHHLGYLVDDLSAHLDFYARRGIGVVQSGERQGVGWAYLNTTGPAGLLIELIQRDEI